MALAVYNEIKDKILKEIEIKAINEHIESERELAKRFNISRMTARRAIDELVEEGFLYRNKNKGTFVADPKLRKKNTASMALDYQYDENEFKILHFNISTASEDIAKNLNVSLDTPILKLVRLVFNEGLPACIEEICIIKKKIDVSRLDPVKELMDVESFIGKGKISQVFEPMLVPVQYASLLNLKINTPIIAIHNTVNNRKGKPLVHSVIYNNPKVRKIEITI